MATDVEESDTEDNERPIPPKRKCTQVAKNNEENDKQRAHQSVQGDYENIIETESDYEHEERLTREKLRRWQACQVAKGFVDNTINRVMENYILGHQADSSQFRLFRGTEMEDTAVMMAIRNHGLVHSNQLNSLTDDKEPWTDTNMLQSISSPSNSIDLAEIKNCSTSTSSTSPKIFSTSSLPSFHQDIKDKPEDGDQQDFLERAVAEAIKIKGLSALSADYG